MQILNDSDKEIIKSRLENELVNEINITLFTQTDLGGLIIPGREGQTCPPTEQYSFTGAANEQMLVEHVKKHC
jgi:hypothetical protein